MIIDGVAYYVNWENFHPGSSFFIPTVDPEGTKKLIKRMARGKGMEVAMKTSIEERIKGVRAWRV